MIILAVAGLSVIVLTKTVTIHRSVFILYLLLIFFGIFYTFVGLINHPMQIGNVLKASTVTVIWPFFFLFLMPLFSQWEDIMKPINKTLIYSVLFIGVYMLFAALAYLRILPIPVELFFNTKLVEGKYDASVQLFDPSITSLMYLLPFLICYLLLKQGKQEGNSVFILLAGLLVGLIAMVVSGRRALILNVLLAPVLLVLFLTFKPSTVSASLRKSLITNIALMIGAVFVLMLLLIQTQILNFDALLDSFLQGFDTQRDESSRVRGSQSVGLIQSFFDYPIFGSGLGTSSQYVIRSYDTPWIYELSYLAMLYQTGLSGIIYYSTMLICIVYFAVSLISKGEISLLPHLIGLLCFLVANASNPYLAAFDHLWPLFLMLGFTNYTKLKKS
ncbi:O-antigen ligase family protein [Sphingobacterium paludis]|uniref:O-antigen ligase-like membrane protein n=1 Tax=Sphingobacterium paludis TaxID=1476465 RepID=A0A4R7D079_9SPHI|nr:O-antigen ligase family protein [Sphingobacterium paludis]TDS13697.1 hypothetical protein B0I21_10423 [Sphingobacterium paludis]